MHVFLYSCLGIPTATTAEERCSDYFILCILCIVTAPMLPVKAASGICYAYMKQTYSSIPHVHTPNAWLHSSAHCTPRFVSPSETTTKEDLTRKTPSPWRAFLTRELTRQKLYDDLQYGLYRSSNFRGIGVATFAIPKYCRMLGTDEGQGMQHDSTGLTAGIPISLVHGCLM